MMDRIKQELENGGAVVLPTETVYGLFAKALDEKAVNHVYQIKRRPRDKALNLNIASLEDIIPLKVEAVMNRGSKKDFWDLHEILEHYSLSTIISLYEKKYPYISFNSEMLAQFIHFEEADNDNDPICLKGKHWELIKLDIEEAVIKEN